MFHLSFIRFQAVSLTVSHESVKVNIMPETKILRLVFINMYLFNYLIIFGLEGSQRQQNSFPPRGNRQKVETGTSFSEKLCYSAPMPGHFLTKNNFIGANRKKYLLNLDIKVAKALEEPT